MTSRLPALALIASLVLTGCYSFEASRISKRVGQDIERQTGANVGSGISMGLGPVSLATVQAGAWAFAPETTREARQIGRHISSVKFSVRSVQGEFNGTRIARPAYLDRYDRNGWYPLLSVRDSSEAVWVMLRERGREAQITNLLAVVVTEEEVVVTKISGHLSDMIEEAIRLGTESELLGETLRETGLIEEDEASGDEPDAPPIEAQP